MKTFPNPWYDARNELSPREFEVSDEPIEAVDVLEFYEVLNEHQRPSVLVVRVDMSTPHAIRQCVTIDGAKRWSLPRTLLHGYGPCDCDSACPNLNSEV